jgi:hypothetical protein
MKALVVVCLSILIGALIYLRAQTTTPVHPSGRTGLSIEANPLPSGANGRYQVIAADIDAEGMGGELKHKTAIRIDTQTGRTWSLDEISDNNGGANFYWVPLQEIK